MPAAFTVPSVVTRIWPPAVLLAETPRPLASIFPVPAFWPILMKPLAEEATMPSPPTVLEVTPAVSMVTVPTPRVLA